MHPEDEARARKRARARQAAEAGYLIRERLGRDEERGEEKYALALAERALASSGRGVDAFVQEVMRGENEDDQGGGPGVRPRGRTTRTSDERCCAGEERAPVSRKRDEEF